MNRMAVLVVALGSACLVGCGAGAGGQRVASEIDVTATVTGPDGKPLSKSLVVILQPAGDTLGARLVAKEDGKFTGKAAQGKYIYYIKSPNSDAPPKGIPAKYSDPKSEHAIEVLPGTPLSIKLTN